MKCWLSNLNDIVHAANALTCLALSNTQSPIITVYIHLESIYCIRMVSLFDWQSIAKAVLLVFTLFGHCNRTASFCNRMQVKKTDHPNAAYRLKVNVDGDHGAHVSII